MMKCVRTVQLLSVWQDTSVDCRKHFSCAHQQHMSRVVSPPLHLTPERRTRTPAAVNLHFECAGSVFLCFSHSPGLTIYQALPYVELAVHIQLPFLLMLCLPLLVLGKTSEPAFGLKGTESETDQRVWRPLENADIYVTMRDFIFLSSVCLEMKPAVEMSLHYLKVWLAICPEREQSVSRTHLRSVAECRSWSDTFFWGLKE